MATSYESRLKTSPEEGTKAPVWVSTTSNIALMGEQSINGVPVSVGMRVLVKVQDDSTENGIYDVSIGTWERSSDFNDSTDVVSGQLVPDSAGGFSVNSSIWLVELNDDRFLPGVTEVMFSKAISYSGYGDSDVANLNKKNGVTAAVGFESKAELSSFTGYAIAPRVYADGSDWFHVATGVDDGGDYFGTMVSCASGGFWQREIGDDGLINFKWFGGRGDYDPVIEAEGQDAVFATDNYPSLVLVKAAIERIGGGTLFIPSDNYGSDYYFGNMTALNMSNFRLFIPTGVIWRTETPTSIGAVLSIGSAESTNVSVTGGGSVRGHRQELTDCVPWAANTAYSEGTYISNSKGYAFYCNNDGVSGATEPVFTARAENNGTIFLYDAWNDNAIAASGKNVLVQGMTVLSASDKGITCQAPGSENVTFRDNKIYSTLHDGIEVKGNQGLVSDLTIKNVTIDNNYLEDIGRVGIEAIQPTFGSSDLENFVVTNNRIKNVGKRIPLTYTGSSQVHAGIKLNRVNGLHVSSNIVEDVDGVGFTVSSCINTTGDITVNDSTNIGINFNGNENYTFTKVHVKSCGVGFAAVRENTCIGQLDYGAIIVEGSNHDYAFEELSRSRADTDATATSIKLEAGTSGLVNGGLPALPVRFIDNDNRPDCVHVSGQSTLDSATIERVIDLSTGGRLLSATMTGPLGSRFFVNLDDGGTMHFQPVPLGNGQQMIVGFPCVAANALKLSIQNFTGSDGMVIDWTASYLPNLSN